MPLSYLHPIVGAATVALLFYAGSLGLRSRNVRRGKAELLQRHRRIAPVAFGFNLVSWIFGLLSVWTLRPDLELAASMHLRIGSALVLVLGAAYACSRSMSSLNRRNIHVALGSVGLLLAVAQVFFGLQITP